MTANRLCFCGPFSRDKPQFWYRLYRRIFWSGGYFQEVYTSEEILADILSTIGPFVALGMPGERVATPGAARSYVDDSEWQTEIHTWLRKAQAVVFQVGDGEGVWREFQMLVRDCVPQTVLLFVPSFADERERAQHYARFRLKVASVLPHPLPGDLGSSVFISFDGDWQPRALPFARLSLRQYIPIALRSRQYKSFVEIVVSIAPFLRKVAGSEVVLPGVDLERFSEGGDAPSERGRS